MRLAVLLRTLLSATIVLAMSGPSHANPPAAPAAATPGGIDRGKARFLPVAFSELPGWADDDHAAAFKAFRASCPKVIALARSGRPRKQPIPVDMIAACEEAMRQPEKASRGDSRAFFERHFQPHRVVHANPHGLLTGYYEPLMEGARTKSDRFQSPLYKRPPDLVTVVEETQRSAVGQLTHARQTRAGLVPFATRAEIDEGALGGQGLELLWLRDPVDKFFLQIQGSGRVRLTDGTTIRVHYDGKNGHPYTSIGRFLIDKGLLAADKVSMGALGRWLRADPARGRFVMQQNASYVFFRELPDGAGGPLGAIEVSLVPGRSLAIDPSVHTLGAPIYVSAPTLTHARQGKPFTRLMVAHDVGSAIKGPERGDIYFGSGDTAGRIAGITKHPGHLFALVARSPAAAADAKGGVTAKPAAKQAKQ
jgi:membrane-bound lytic murein transglycosylase A